MTPASASLRGLPGPAGFAPGCVNPAGSGCAGTWGTTGEYGGYCGGGIWVCVCSYHSGAVGCDPSSGGRCDQGSCDAGCWLVPSGPVVAGGVPSAGSDQGSCDAGCWLVPSGGVASGPMLTGRVPSGGVPSGGVDSGGSGGCCVMGISLD